MAATIPVKSLNWPIAIGPDGKFETAFTVYEAWGQRVKALLSTRLGERAMRTDYGCGLAGSLFHPTGALSAEQEVRTAMSKWLPRLTVDKVIVTALGSEVQVQVVYTTPDGSTQDVALAYKKGVFA